MAIDKDDKIFENTTFSDILKEIHKNQKHKGKQIEILINELRPFVKKLSDAAMIVPLIKDYLDISVKNDEQLIKMAQIYQRYIAAENRVMDPNDGGGGLLSPEEKEDLLQKAKEQAEKELDDAGLSDKKSELDEKFEEMFKKTEDVLKSNLGETNV